MCAPMWAPRPHGGLPVRRQLPASWRLLRRLHHRMRATSTYAIAATRGRLGLNRNNPTYNPITSQTTPTSPKHTHIPTQRAMDCGHVQFCPVKGASFYFTGVYQMPSPAKVSVNATALQVVNATALQVAAFVESNPSPVKCSIVEDHCIACNTPEALQADGLSFCCGRPANRPFDKGTGCNAMGLFSPLWTITLGTSTFQRAV
jgi:hypothetical protein